MRPLHHPRAARATAVLAASGAALVFAVGASSHSASPAALPPVDHFKCYAAAQVAPFKYQAPAVRLDDQFGKAFHATQPVQSLCNPVDKKISVPGGVIDTPIQHPDLHLVCYGITSQPTTAPPPSINISITNQFGTARLTLKRPARRLCVPSFKSLTPFNDDLPVQVPGLDHYKCYDASYTLDASGAPIQKFKGIPAPGSIQLTDQFGPSAPTVVAPRTVCAPTVKWVDPAGPSNKILFSAWHLVCFSIRESDQVPERVFAANQFGKQGLAPKAPAQSLCVPSNNKVIITG